MKDVYEWIAKEPWAEIDPDDAASFGQFLEKTCELVEGAKKTLQVTGTNFYSVRTHPELHQRFIDALRAKLNLLKAGKFNHIVFVCDRTLFSDTNGGEAPVIGVLKEFMGTPGFQVYVGLDRDAAIFNHSVIADGKRGLIGT